MSRIFFRFRRTTNKIIGAANPDRNATRIVTTVFRDSVSSIKANSVKTIIVKDGGTKSVEMILASLSDLFILSSLRKLA